MELKYSESEISFDKELNPLDELVLSFTSILNKLKIKYVIVSGYVAILFGRSRASEDIDLFIEKIGLGKFNELWNELMKDFDCINAEDMANAYNNYLVEWSALRFSKKGKFIPNMELKFPKNELDVWTLNKRKKVVLNKQTIFISPLELQIPFKLSLGSEKDIEDARFLYKLFKEHLNLDLLKDFNRKLKIADLFKKYLE